MEQEQKVQSSLGAVLLCIYHTLWVSVSVVVLTTVKSSKCAQPYSEQQLRQIFLHH